MLKRSAGGGAACGLALSLCEEQKRKTKVYDANGEGIKVGDDVAEKVKLTADKEVINQGESMFISGDRKVIPASLNTKNAALLSIYSVIIVIMNRGRKSTSRVTQIFENTVPVRVIARVVAPVQSAPRAT